MTLKPYAAAAAIAALLLAGCGQRQDTPRSSAVEPPTRTSAADTSTPLSTADPSVPSADSAINPKPGEDGAATPNGDAKTNPAVRTGGDATADSAVTPVERDREMPLKGQVNDHSTPDRAKEGDQPNTASKEPGGQEANKGNLTGNSKEATR